MTPSWRKPVGALGILTLTIVWCVLVASFAGPVSSWPPLGQLGFYLVTGVIWIAPLGPALKWMETGRWR